MDPSGSRLSLSESPILSAKQRRKQPSPAPPVDISQISLDPSRLDTEIALLFSEYLDSRSYGHIARIIDEQVLDQPRLAQREEVDQVKRALTDGDFGSIEALLARPGLLKPQTQKAFLYMCYRHQFLEHIENRESQKAFNLLQKRLKPLEHYQPYPYDFYSLSYLISAGTVHDLPSFKDWAGVEPEREKLVSMWRELVESEHLRPADLGQGKVQGPGEGKEGSRKVKEGRLVQLLAQAAAWQVQQCERRRSGPWRIPSLLEDFHPMTLPTRMTNLLHLHKSNIKSLTFLNSEGTLAASGSSDCTVKIFSTVDGSVRHTLRGHTSRVWDLDANATGMLASASGDGSVRLWSTEGESRGVLEGDGGDVYGVRWRTGHEDQLVTANYDRILRLYSTSTGQLIRTFSGHSHSCLAVATDSTGNLIASGSKDRHVRLWDAVGGVCVVTAPACLGEVTSVEFDQYGRYLLAGCKDNSIRLWDLRMQRNLYRYTGHQNTAKNLIRCSFAQDCNLVVGGSENGKVYIWEREGAAASTTLNTNTLLPPNNPSTASTPPMLAQANGTRASPAYYPKPSAPAHVAHSGGTNVRPLHVLEGHGEGAVFDVRWRAGMMVSAGEDGCVGVWDGEDDV